LDPGSYRCSNPAQAERSPLRFPACKGPCFRDVFPRTLRVRLGNEARLLSPMVLPSPNLEGWAILPASFSAL
jgi:hypothetical protein